MRDTSELEKYKSAEEFMPLGRCSSNQSLKRHLVSLFTKTNIQKNLRGETAEVIIFNLIHFQTHKAFKVDMDKTLVRFRKAFDALIDAGYLENLGYSQKLRMCTRYKFTKTLLNRLKTPLKLDLYAYKEVYKKKKDVIGYKRLKNHSRTPILNDYMNLMKGTDLRTDKRVFNQLDLSMAFGEELNTLGRIYHQVQTIPKEERLTLMIDGENTVECDIVGCHLRFLYALAGESSFTSEDPYTAQVESNLFGNDEVKARRKLSKVALLTMINAKSPQSAFKSILNPTGDRYWDLRKRATKVIRESNQGVSEDELMTLVSQKLKEEVTTLVAALRELNIVISPFLATSVAGLLQYLESEVLVTVMSKLTEMNIKHITIHDAVAVPESDQVIVDKIMNDELNKMVNKIIGNRDNLISEYQLIDNQEAA